MERYDYLVVGSGLFGAVFTCEAIKAGKKVLVLEKREHTGGNIYTENVEGIEVHKYGAHIFHTSDKKIWDYVNEVVPFNNFINTPVANYKGEIYNLPFNMNTFSKMFGVFTPYEAKEILKLERGEIEGEPKNLEEQAISLVGRTVYTKLIKGYTEKQWGRSCKELPSFLIKRLPVRYTYNNNYFSDRYQGIPENGYSELINKLLEGADIRTGVDFLDDPERYRSLADNCLYTGQLDSLFGYNLGMLEYRSLKFETELKEIDNYQGVAVMNYTDRETPYTRIIEHKHFAYGCQPVTVITKEYPANWKPGMEPYYPVNDERNSDLYEKYRVAAEKSGILIGGRLAEYRYFDMDDTVKAALELSKKVL